MNPDGSFNVARHGLSFLESLSLYHSLLTMPWRNFFLTTAGFYLIANLLFAFAYFSCGPGALHGSVAESAGTRFLEAFFFSVQTFTTIGYGRISPFGLAANIVVAVEALAGLLGLALVTGLLFARFSRPNPKILFSHKAIVAPYRGILAFEFRVINLRSSQLIEVEVTLILSRLEEDQGRRVRRFYELPLERKRVKFFPLHWTLVHAIGEESPLLGVTSEVLQAWDAEFLILLTAIDEDFSQSVHARSSYRYDEVVVGARFTDMFDHSNGGINGVDVRRLHEIEIV